MSALITSIAAILSTLNGTDGAPESTLYIALDCNMERWTQTRNALVALGWATCFGNWIALTPAGKAKADEIDALVK